jgi:hypothetical protein
LSGTAISMSPELRELIRRVALFQHGLGFLHQADVDCIAVTLGVHPFVVVEARRRLETPEGRALLIGALRLARGGAAGAAPAVPRPPRERTIPPQGTGIRALLRTADRHPLGLPFLMEAPFESVAVTFRVHPFVVLQARTLLARRESRRRKPGTSQED